MISDAIGDNELPMPMRHLTLQDAVDDFDKLKELKTGTLIKDAKFYSRYDYKYSFIDNVITSCNIGNKASDYFHQFNRWRCDSINAPSPERSWTIEKFRLTLLNALWTLKVDEVNSKTLRSLIGLRKYIASQFRPSAAKAVYDIFNSKNVLDISSGWGDRLCGFCASDSESYLGIDPNERLIDGYEEQRKLYGSDKNIEMVNSCAEEYEYGSRTFDTIFTSPPYFNIERYTQENTQSFKKFRKLQDWLDSFLYVALGNAWKVLRKNGYMIINISDVYSNHTINKICDPMCDFISHLPDSKYLGCMGYEMRKRPNSKAVKEEGGVFAEPMWVFKKY